VIDGNVGLSSRTTSTKQLINHPETIPTPRRAFSICWDCRADGLKKKVEGWKPEKEGNGEFYYWSHHDLTLLHSGLGMFRRGRQHPLSPSSPAPLSPQSIYLVPRSHKIIITSSPSASAYYLNSVVLQYVRTIESHWLCSDTCRINPASIYQEVRSNSLPPRGGETFLLFNVSIPCCHAQGGLAVLTRVF
jgi:hypothetical protein